MTNSDTKISMFDYLAGQMEPQNQLDIDADTLLSRYYSSSFHTPKHWEVLHEAAYEVILQYLEESNDDA